jgi:hypothetical protein
VVLVSEICTHTGTVAKRAGGCRGTPFAKEGVWSMAELVVRM